MVLICLSLVIGALIICLLYKWATGPSLPRGPRGLPFVGNMFQIDPTGLHKTLSKWGETYGGVFTISVLGQDIVVLRSFEALYEGLVLKENDLSGRPPCYRARQVNIYVLPHIHMRYTHGLKTIITHKSSVKSFSKEYDFSPRYDH